jgi:hypothetical protein
MKATAIAMPPSHRGPLSVPITPINANPAATAICVTSIQPRRRPNQGRVIRSITGAQRNFRLYGRPTSVNIPMVFRSTPATVNQACRVPDVSARGSPEANPNGSISAMRLFPRICAKEAAM